MDIIKKLLFTFAAMTFAVTLPLGADFAQATTPVPTDPVINPTTGQPYMRSLMKSQQRQEAAARAAAARAATKSTQGKTLNAAPLAVMNPGGTPDYFGTIPNYANSQLPTLDPVTGAITGGIRKFVDTMPGLSLPSTAPATTNALGQYIPVAAADTSTFAGCDYYEIALVEYTMRMHSDLPVTGVKLRGYVQIETPANAAVSKHYPLTYPNGSQILNAAGAPVFAVDSPQYLGPVILSQAGKAVRIKFTNYLPTGTDGNLFIPCDTSYMGAGIGPNGGSEMYLQNRAVVHLHGGATPWISDGTPHQWTIPFGETSSYARGLSYQTVPDMWFDTSGNVIPGASLTPPALGATNDPGQGSVTLYYTNQQSARLMFYHDHVYGTTRLDVYAGEAAGYLITDQVEEDLISGTNVSGINPGLVKAIPDLGGVYHLGVPLIIQDKTFVPNVAQLAAEDPTWNWAGEGNLWFPHVYMPNQNPADLSGANACGRWDYGPWFWPPVTAAAGLQHIEVPNPLAGTTPAEGPVNPGTPNPSGTPESFMDTPVVNGTAYPVLPVTRQPYRFRILNACNDRYLNLQLYYADPVGLTLISGGTGYTSAPSVIFSSGTAAATATITNVVNSIAVQNGGAGYTTPPTVYITGGGGVGASAVATITGGVVTAVTVVTGGAGYTTAPVVSFSSGSATATAAITGVVNGLTVTSAGTGYTTAPTVTISGGGGTGAIAIASPNTEVRMVPAVPNTTWPAGWPMPDGRAGGFPDPTMIGPNFVQIGTEGGFLPAPVVIPNRPVGYEYNRRSITVLNVLEKALYLGPAERADVIVDFSQVPAGVNNVILYNDAPTPMPAFDPRTDYYSGDPDQTSTGGAPTTIPGYGPNTRTIMQFQVSGTATAPFNLATLQAAWNAAYTTTQEAPIVPESAYGPTFGTTFTDTYSRIQDTSLTYTPAGSTTPVTTGMEPKAIQELFELNYGRMNATMGLEMPGTNFNIQVTIPLGYIDPLTETINNGQVQIWKITHNGVDTHAIHFHLFNVQLINRVGWDGAIKPPAPNELGWKETVLMNPLEDCIVALKPVAPTLPFNVPDSVRPLDVTQPLHATISVTDPTSGNPILVDNYVNLGWEYVLHCHLLGHEENDMMRPVAFILGTPTVPGAPLSPTATAGNQSATVSFFAPLSNGGSAITGYTVQQIPGPGGAVGTDLNAGTTALTHTITGLTNAVPYTFTVTATNAIGTGPASVASNSVTPYTIPDAPTIGTATANVGSAVVNFTPPVFNGGSPIISYTATAYTGGVPAVPAITATVMGAAATSVTVTGLTNGNPYTFVVVATNLGGNSLPSAQSNAVIPVGVPDPPTIGTATPGNAQATVTFTAPGFNGGSAITGYTATAYIGGVAQAQTATVGAAATSATVTGLTNGQAYTFAVVATNVNGNSLPSAQSNSVTPYTVPNAPAIGSVTPGNTQVLVNFTAPVFNGGSAITGYTATAYIGGVAQAQTATVGAAATSATVTGLTNGTAYTFKVVATNLAGNSLPSGASASATPYTIPNAPTIGTATAGDAQATVTFTPPANNGGNAITGYTATAYVGGSPAGISATVPAPATSITIGTLTNGTAYTFTVYATNLAGNSLESSQSNAVTPSSVPPAAPTVLAVTSTFTSPNPPSVSLSWHDNSSNEAGFTIQRATNSSFSSGVTNIGVGANVTTYTDTSVLANTRYYYRVRAFNSAGTSAWSNSVNALTVAIPGNFTATASRTLGRTTDTVALSWTYSGAVTGFTVQRAANAAFTSGLSSSTVGSTVRSLTQTGLTRLRTYYYRIRANTGAGSSAWSSLSVATP